MHKCGDRWWLDCRQQLENLVHRCLPEESLKVINELRYTASVWVRLNGTCRVRASEVYRYNEVIFPKFVYCPRLSHTGRLNDGSIIGVNFVLAVIVMLCNVFP